MRKVRALLLAMLLVAPVAFAEEAETPTERRDPGAPTYESPVLSLLFLPVNLLIKMASVFGPDSSSSSSSGSSASSGNGK